MPSISGIVYGAQKYDFFPLCSYTRVHFKYFNDDSFSRDFSHNLSFTQGHINTKGFILSL